MSTTTGRWSGYGTAIALIPGTEFNNKATGSWMTSGSTLLNNGTNKDQLVDIEFVLPSPVTAGSGSPRLDIYIVPAPNSTTAMMPPGTTAGLTPPQYYVGNVHANPSASFTSGTLPRVTLPPGRFVCTAQCNLGVNTPTSNSATLLAYPYNDQGVTA